MRIFAAFLFLSALSLAASAQTTHTFIASSGDDLNPCTHTLPCRTWGGAVPKTLKEGGITPLDSAGFGTLTITNSITIDGGPFFAGSHGIGSDSITINITDFVNDPAATVTLRNLNIVGAGNALNGVRILSARKVVIENCRIYGFRAGTGRGIDIQTSVPNLAVFVSNCTISGNSGQGIYSSGAGSGATALSVEDSKIVQNGASAIDMVANTRATVVRCGLNENGSAGVFAEAASTDADVSHTSFQHNIIAASALNGASIRLFDSVLTHNFVSINGNVLSHGNNAVVNNNVNPLPALLPTPALQ
ncbi:MAG TPA: right-handed parallel beta-helix repeat-containing protein [Thermoanaerobaculia bacterium]|nr:right-handed parallel beta-helix repeat-containing protein [Thermoanaerobaculia bacterium]